MAVSARNSLTERFLDGDRTALARLITWAERGDERFDIAIERLYERVGQAWRVGITGPPGAGKSTLVNQLAARLREREKTVGILAVDPSSPFTGGALLGDRIRMEERSLDPGVFIRSMASRDSHGGLARAAVDACDVMDAFGLESLLLETVGVGQAEYDVLDAADTVLVVLCPGAGDGIQAMKAGLLEVADVLVVNKSDLPGADRLVDDLQEAVHVRFRPGDAARTRDPKAGNGDEQAWSVPVVSVSAARAEGLDDLLGAIDDHRAYLEARGLDAIRREKRVEQVQKAVLASLDRELWNERGLRDQARARLAQGDAPHTVARTIFRELTEKGLPERPL